MFCQGREGKSWLHGVKWVIWGKLGHQLNTAVLILVFQQKSPQDLLHILWEKWVTYFILGDPVVTDPLYPNMYITDFTDYINITGNFNIPIASSSSSAEMYLASRSIGLALPF